ncbi:hypothetical protein AYJ54_02550 [Bradyrhizobium centrolobii]|uniref:Cysteine rich repeat protein n=1 Tax=Bradyrhizobium centrolobii TaxID=1505087 RepID=A0A176YGM6_9BRAD|nr:hypothetical protein AYJ54_02550 [Bradyrhizobium centrolobii]
MTTARHAARRDVGTHLQLHETDIASTRMAMMRVVLSALILIWCIQGVPAQDQRGKESGDTTHSEGQVRSACQPEIEKLCGGQGRRAGRCLRSQNPDALSEKCKTALENRGLQ